MTRLDLASDDPVDFAAALGKGVGQPKLTGSVADRWPPVSSPPDGGKRGLR